MFCRVSGNGVILLAGHWPRQCPSAGCFGIFRENAGQEKPVTPSTLMLLVRGRLFGESWLIAKMATILLFTVEGRTRWRIAVLRLGVNTV